MSKRRRRLGKIETSLTPTQAMVLWMDEAHRFPSMVKYADSLLDGPDNAWPLHRLTDQIEAATLEAMKGRSNREKDWAVKRAVRDVAFLFFVHQGANVRFLQEWRAMHLGVMLLAAGSRRLMPIGNSRSEGDDGRRDVWRSRAKVTLAELHGYREAMEMLSRTYLAGHGVLFHEAADGLEFCVKAAETLVENYNHEVEFSVRGRSAAERKRLLLDVEPLRKGVHKSAMELVEDIVALAKGEALELVGESERSRSVVKRRHEARSTTANN
jgi:hypothetical protein